jgi:hypothetical protein
VLLENCKNSIKASNSTATPTPQPAIWHSKSSLIFQCFTNQMEHFWTKSNKTNPNNHWAHALFTNSKQSTNFSTHLSTKTLTQKHIHINTRKHTNNTYKHINILGENAKMKNITVPPAVIGGGHNRGWSCRVPLCANKRVDRRRKKLSAPKPFLLCLLNFHLLYC